MTPYNGCFLAGSLVTMSDGTQKKIEDVIPNDTVRGAFGEINTVVALSRSILGNRLMYKINDDHDTSSDNMHVSVDKQFYSCDLESTYNVYGYYYRIILEENHTEYWRNKGLDYYQPLVVGIELQTVNGAKKIDTITEYTLPDNTQLYDLVVSDSHTYFVNGYAVTGWPRDDNWDYITWTSTGVILTPSDYKY